MKTYVNCRWRIAFCTLEIPLSTLVRRPDKMLSRLKSVPGPLVDYRLLCLVGLPFIPVDGASAFGRNFSETLLACSSPPWDRSCFCEKLNEIESRTPRGTTMTFLAFPVTSSVASPQLTFLSPSTNQRPYYIPIICALIFHWNLFFLRH
jgi:hypothetical protein